MFAGLPIEPLRKPVEFHLGFFADAPVHVVAKPYSPAAIPKRLYAAVDFGTVKVSITSFSFIVYPLVCLANALQFGGCGEDFCLNRGGGISFA